MKVRDLMKSHPSVAFGGQSLQKVGTIMAQVECGVLPVLGEGDVVVGLVTDRDICLSLAERDARPSEVPVEVAMSANVHACSPDDELGTALSTMRENRVRRLPVVDAAGHLKGLLSFDDIVLEAREGDVEQAEGPFYADIALTLQAINRHELPTPSMARPA